MIADERFVSAPLMSGVGREHHFVEGAVSTPSSQTTISEAVINLAEAAGRWPERI